MFCLAARSSPAANLATYINCWLSDPLDPDWGIGDYMKVRLILPYRIECDDDTREGLSRMLDIELPKNELGLPEIFARRRWRGCPEEFYEPSKR